MGVRAGIVKLASRDAAHYPRKSVGGRVVGEHNRCRNRARSGLRSSVTFDLLTRCPAGGAGPVRERGQMPAGQATEAQLRFRDAMARFASGVTIVTTTDDTGQLWGFTASSFCSLSLQPPLVLVCLDRSADCYPVFRARPRFLVNILSTHHRGLALRFATKGGDKPLRLSFVRCRRPSEPSQSLPGSHGEHAGASAATPRAGTCRTTRMPIPHFRRGGAGSRRESARHVRREITPAVSCGAAPRPSRPRNPSSVTLPDDSRQSRCVQ